jgi:hypothetical protein
MMIDSNAVAPSTMSPLGPPNDLNQATAATPASAGQVREDFKKRLTDEYKMLQDKIDKIGAFRFTIKGWSVTAVIAASAASGNAKGLLTVLTISFGLAVMLIFFFMIELEQVKLSNLFGDRARRLEDAFVRIDGKRRDAARLPFPVPYTVNEIASIARGQRVLRAGRLNRIEAPRSLKRRIAEEWRLWHRTHFFFYVVLFILSFALPCTSAPFRHRNSLETMDNARNIGTRRTA